MGLIQIELTEAEQFALLGLLIASTNGIIEKGDPQEWLQHLESVEEKIRAAQDDTDILHGKLPIIYDERGA